MNGFRNSSRNGQVWRWQRAGSRAVILEGQWTLDGSGRSMATGCRCCAPDRLAAVCPKKGCTLPPALPGKGVTKKAAFITPGVRRLNNA